MHAAPAVNTYALDADRRTDVGVFLSFVRSLHASSDYILRGPALLYLPPPTMEFVPTKS